MPGQKKPTKKLLNNYRFCMQEFMSNHVLLPDILLEEYRQLKLNEAELIQLLRIVKRSKNWSRFTLQEIVDEFSVNTALAEKILLPFLEKGLICLSDSAGGGVYTFDGLFDELSEIWFYDKSSQKSAESAETGQKKAQIRKTDDKLGQLYKTFEKELGRGLSPMENDKLTQWLEIDGISCEVILEALRRAVLQGKTTLNYIDRILLNWQKQNLLTVSQIEEKDRRPAAAVLPPAKKKAAPAPQSPYNRVYDRIYK